MPKKISLLLIVFQTFLNQPLFSQAPKSYSSAEVLLQIKKLNTVGSVLYIAAHPDDENTRLISYLANEKCLRTGYLSLTRGDGGQNLIGSEQGVELGLIRTQELIAARRIDGGEQYFTRAYDFGFSKTPEETFDKWTKDSILADVVWVIRNFRPDIIITRFATDGSGGHGHHTASGILAEEAFEAAADSTRFTDQLNYVKVWKTKRLVYNTTARFRDPKADMSKYIKLDVGGYNALLGKSYGEIAAESRSMHKSQGFGSARQRGEFLEHFKPIKGDTANLKDIFDRMDFSWKRVKGGEDLGKLGAEVLKKYDVNKPDAIVPILIKFKDRLVSSGLANIYPDKMDKVQTLILASLGVMVDVTADAPQSVPGISNKLTISSINRSSKEVQILKVSFPGNIKGQNSSSFDTSVNAVLKSNVLFSFNSYTQLKFDNNTKSISQPYWLDSMPLGMFYNPDKFSRSLPEVAFNTNVLITFKIGNSLVNKFYPIQYRWVDPEKGELHRPFVIAPPVLLSIEKDVHSFSDNTSKELRVKVKAGRNDLNTSIKVQLPGYWQVEPSEIPVNLPKKNDEITVVFKITPPINNHADIAKVMALVDGELISKEIREIKYDHIPVQTWFPEAQTKMIRMDVATSNRSIGYIPGAGDEVQSSLAQFGYQVTTLTDETINTADLNVYNVIITGIRAYNTNELLTSKKQKLMDFVSRGGTLIVQYNTNSFAGPFKGDIGPYPFKITRERVTDENAKVTFDLPEHPVLNTPNKLTAKDFEGWIQERGIYFAGEMDSMYTCPLSMHDKGEKPNKGSLIIANYGKGKFIYTGLVFFRELPAGIPGAYRLMVNLIEH